jgi:hypothetical protein
LKGKLYQARDRMLLLDIPQTTPTYNWVVQAIFAVGAAGAIAIAAMWRYIIGFNKRFDEANKRLEALTREAITAMLKVSQSSDALAEMLKNSQDKLATTIQNNSETTISLIKEFREEMRRS